jgi:MFS family permease
MMWFCAVFGVASSISLMGVFDTYLYIQSNDSNSAVGFAESISGITQVVAVLPAGYLADKFSRAGILRWCVILSLVYVGISIWGISLDNINLIYISLVLGGIYAAIQNSTSFALFSDSVPQGDRAYWTSRLAIVTQISMGVGPLIGLLMFKYFGNEWDIRVLHTVLNVGYALMIPANLYLWNWTDVVSSSPIMMSSIDPSSDHPTRHPQSYLVPYLVCLNDVITCIGAGMTVKFFPLFFKNDYGFNPAELQLLFTVYCISFALFTWLCERLSGMVGRVQACLLFSALGVACLFALAYIQYLPLVLLVFMLRGALQNSIYPIDRSIIMDFVPSNQRGRWNSIESLSAMTWSGSALIGGYLMDTHDYRYTFVITGWIYLFACILRLPLLVLVPRREKFDNAKNIISSSPLCHSAGNFAQ